MVLLTAASWLWWWPYALVAGLLWLISGWGLRAYSWYGMARPLEESWHTIDCVMRGGADDARVHIRHPASGRRVQFVKHFPRHERMRFYLQLKDVWCTAEEFAAAQEALRRTEIEFEVEEGDGAKRRWLPAWLAWILSDASVEEGVAARRLTVECGLDERKGQRAVSAIFVKAFGLERGVKVHVGTSGSVSGLAAIRPDHVIGQKKGWYKSTNLDEFLKSPYAPEMPAEEKPAASDTSAEEKSGKEARD